MWPKTNEYMVTQHPSKNKPGCISWFQTRSLAILTTTKPNSALPGSDQTHTFLLDEDVSIQDFISYIVLQNDFAPSLLS